jgi:hypothetical protein
MSFRPFGSLRGYRSEWLSSDAIAGLTVWAVLVPEALAYATIAGAPPVVGLYAAPGALLMYAVFGSSRHLVTGPMSATAALSAAAVAQFATAGSGVFVTLTAGARDHGGHHRRGRGPAAAQLHLGARAQGRGRFAGQPQLRNGGRRDRGAQGRVTRLAESGSRHVALRRNGSGPCRIRKRSEVHPLGVTWGAPWPSAVSRAGQPRPPTAAERK